jgi:hypothetical protein
VSVCTCLAGLALFSPLLRPAGDMPPPGSCFTSFMCAPVPGLRLRRPTGRNESASGSPGSAAKGDRVGASRSLGRGCGFGRAAEVLEDVHHLAGAPVVCLKGLLVVGAADFM